MNFEVRLFVNYQAAHYHHMPANSGTLLIAQDPMIRKRALQLLVFFSTTALNKNAGFMLKVLEHILLTWPTLDPEHRAYNDAVKELQSESMVELQRLAAEMPDHLLVRQNVSATSVE